MQVLSLIDKLFDILTIKTVTELILLDYMIELTRQSSGISIHPLQAPVTSVFGQSDDCARAKPSEANPCEDLTRGLRSHYESAS